MKAQQQAFLKAMTGGWNGPGGETAPDQPAADDSGNDLDEIKRQLAELQAKMSKMGR